MMGVSSVKSKSYMVSGLSNLVKSFHESDMSGITVSYRPGVIESTTRTGTSCNLKN